jgi:hypothetical protein
VAGTSHARRLFVDLVVRPALALPDGEARLRALVKRWRAWDDTALSGGCLFVAAAVEVDDCPGALRDALVAGEREWFGLLASVVRSAVDNGEFSGQVDPDQTAYEVHALMLGYHHLSRLLATRDEAAARMTTAFERLVLAARPSR